MLSPARPEVVVKSCKQTEGSAAAEHAFPRGTRMDCKARAKLMRSSCKAPAKLLRISFKVLQAGPSSFCASGKLRSRSGSN